MGIPFILWILIIFLALRLIFRWVMPLLLPIMFRSLIKKQARAAGMDDKNIFDTNRRDQRKQEEPKPDKSKTSKTDEGDYIDFEEI